MTTIHKIDNKLVGYTKGSAESILDKCTMIKVNGTVRKLTSNDREAILKLTNELATNALRTLALAKNDVIGDYTKAENNMTWLGLVAMYDPPREEVKETIARCHKAGINVIMVTGDHPATALSVACYVGICKEGAKVVDGAELTKMRFKDLCKAVKEVNVFARVSPTDKINIVKALKHNNQIVAMTGDGVNDSPSLKMADVGVAMGITGTDVAKDAADMILLDDDFNTIESAIKEGRRIYNNIQKLIAFLVSGNVAEILIILIGTLITG
jgi:Ca2+-transporting ATPase